MKLISGTAHPELAQNISKYLNVPLCDVMVKAFPDGETFVKINENIRGQDVFIIQPTCPPTNSNLMELLITVDAAKRASAKRITAVIPFLVMLGRIEKINLECLLPQSWWLTYLMPLESIGF